jgi:hypothetical protein
MSNYVRMLIVGSDYMVTDYTSLYGHRSHIIIWSQITHHYMVTDHTYIIIWSQITHHYMVTDYTSLYGHRSHIIIWSQITVVHVVEEFSRVFIESRGECFGFVEFGIYLLKCLFLLS